MLAAIEFASPWMLGWLAATALPWLVNLWTRRRHVETPWAAVELLMTAVRERSRRLRLRELLLLALRTAILLLAALAAARPLWRTASAGDATAERTHYVLVIDQSMSMSTRADGSTRLERAQERARQIVEEAAAGDAFTVIPWADAADNVLGRPTFENIEALRAIDAIEQLDTVANLPTALRAVEAAVADARREFSGLSRSQTILLSDMAVNTWAAAVSNSREGDRRLALPEDARIERVNDGVRENLAITDIELDPVTPVLDRPLNVSVRLESLGREAIRNVDVELLVDEVRVGRQHVDVPAGQATVVRFDARLTEPGRQVFEARALSDGDALVADNRRWLVTEAKAARRALLSADVATSAEDLARALNPRFRQASDGNDTQVEVISTAGLGSAELASYDAAFICNVAELSERERRLLERYIAEGGAVVLVLGDRVKPTAYNEFLQEVAPIQFSEQASQGDWRLDPLDYRHPIVEPFSGQSRSGLLGVRISHYYPLRVEGADVETPLALNSGDPAIVIGRHGTGRLAVMATDPALQTQGEPWSTLAVSPSFVPLVRELFDYLTGGTRSDEWNRTAGEPLAPASVVLNGAVAEWKDPAGRVTSTPPKTSQLGVYTVNGEPIAVNTDPAESDLNAVSMSDLQAPASADSGVAASEGVGGVVPLASYLLGAAALLMLIELTTAWALGRGWA
jgi:hypothetical protein